MSTPTPDPRVAVVGAGGVSRLYLVRDVPLPDFSQDNYHSGVERLLHLMGEDGLKLHQSDQEGPFSGPQGLLSASDIVLLKVNSQWKCLKRGARQRWAAPSSTAVSEDGSQELRL